MLISPAQSTDNQGISVEDNRPALSGALGRRALFTLTRPLDFNIISASFPFRAATVCRGSGGDVSFFNFQTRSAVGRQASQESENGPLVALSGTRAIYHAR